MEWKEQGDEKKDEIRAIECFPFREKLRVESAARLFLLAPFESHNEASCVSLQILTKCSLLLDLNPSESRILHLVSR
jgi:hypothetical protein